MRKVLYLFGQLRDVDIDWLAKEPLINWGCGSW
jgi:hypothetical protein